MAVNKIGNDYAAALEGLYERTPKAVLAAIAYSFALRLNEEQHTDALTEIITEWRLLHENGIVPQRPPKPDAAG